MFPNEKHHHCIVDSEVQQPLNSFQDLADKYIKDASAILNPDGDLALHEDIASTLRLGLDVIHQCIYAMNELNFYKMKYTKVPPLDLELSKIKKCHIGKCRCGQLLLQERDSCCPKCNQFIAWPPIPKGSCKN